jgi:ubiquinone/menaquinone biosynthesis C-methylase UbiE
VNSLISISRTDQGDELRPVHLVGSVPLADAEEVYLAAAAALGDRLRRLPDGETGNRLDWIAWQLPVLRAQPQFELVPSDPYDYRRRARVKLRPGADPAEISLGRLGYAAAARQSYALFARLKQQGDIPAHYRFLVSLLTPLASVGHLVVPEDQALVEPIYERRMREELRAITDWIPHGDLAIQWDTAIEFGLLEGVFESRFADVERGILERLTRIAGWVPDDIELGYHLCYGDANHKHFKDPTDARLLVRVANGLAASLPRPLDWVHLPVPRNRYDVAYYRPLQDLTLPGETELYLGLVHYTDGVEGTRRRMRAASRVRSQFGVATECGLGRRPPETIRDLLRIHAEVARPPVRSQPSFQWPAGFARIPADSWTQKPLDGFGLQYDAVEAHGWYVNLEPTVAHLQEYLRDGQLVVDYSGGTGILADRLFQRVPDRQIGVIIADSSPKFLRVALEKFRDEPRVAFRLLPYLKAEDRVQHLDEILDPAVVAHGVDAIVSTNAIHLYYDLPQTAKSWARVLRPGGHVFIQSGNIVNPNANPGEWIIDETVAAINELAIKLVSADARYAAYRRVLGDETRMAAYASLRHKFFLPVRPLRHYLQALEHAGFRVLRVLNQTIEARVTEWYDFLAVYHEGVLAWVGGSERLDGAAPSDEAVKDRLELIQRSMTELFGGAGFFPCCWTYIECTPSS